MPFVLVSIAHPALEVPFGGVGVSCVRGGRGGWLGGGRGGVRGWEG